MAISLTFLSIQRSSAEVLLWTRALWPGAVLVEFIYELHERPWEGAINLKRLPHADVLIRTNECNTPGRMHKWAFSPDWSRSPIAANLRQTLGHPGDEVCIASRLSFQTCKTAMTPAVVGLLNHPLPHVLPPSKHPFPKVVPSSFPHHPFAKVHHPFEPPVSKGASSFKSPFSKGVLFSPSFLSSSFTCPCCHLCCASSLVCSCVALPGPPVVMTVPVGAGVTAFRRVVPLPPPPF